MALEPVMDKAERTELSWLENHWEDSGERLVSSTRRACEDPARCGSNAEEEGEEAWMDYPTEHRAEKTNGMRKTREETNKGTQMQQKRVFPEVVYNSPTEESHQQFGAGLTDLDCAATRVPATTGKAIRNLDVTEEIPRPKGGPMITIVTIAQFRYMRDSRYDARSHFKKMSNTMFCAQGRGGISQPDKKQEDCLMGQRTVRRYISPLHCTRRENT